MGQLLIQATVSPAAGEKERKNFFCNERHFMLVSSSYNCHLFENRYDTAREQIKVVYHKHLLLVPITPDIQLPFSGLRKLAPLPTCGSGRFAVRHGASGGL